MAYRGHERNQSVSSLSGASCLDGVPMKISERCLPPPKIALPSDYQTGNPTEVLFMDYDFHLEERVIAWTESQRETKQVLETVETRRIGEVIEQFSRVPAGDDQVAEDPGGSSEDTSQDAANISSPSPSGLPAASPSSATAADTTPASMATTAAAAVAASVPPVNPAPAQPSWLNLGSDILMPTPISVTQSACKTPDGKPVYFDLADFEGVQDPFENAELRILNDREELNKMLTAVQPSIPASTEPSTSTGLPTSQTEPSSGPIPPVSSTQPVNTNSTAPSVPASQVKPAAEGVNMDFLGGKVSFRSMSGMTNGQTSVAGQPVRSLKDVEYPDIFSSSYSSSSASTSRTVPSYQAPSSVYYQPATSHMSMNASVSTSNSPLTNSIYAPPTSSTQHCIVNSNGMSQSTHLSSDLNPHSPSKSTNVYSQCVGYPNGVVTPVNSEQSAGQMNPLRSARSTPDISQCERNLPPVSHTPPPYITESRRSRPNTPTPTQMQNSDSVSPAHGSSITTSPYNMKTSSHTQRSELPDPYSSMSSETKRFVDNISDMGFRRSCVARAVEKLGQDPKQILDHLVLVNRMTEDGYSLDDAEMALFTLSHDESRVLQFLKLLSQFRELGFAENQIKEALISSELDENKTLDQLTAG